MWYSDLLIFIYSIRKLGLIHVSHRTRRSSTSSRDKRILFFSNSKLLGSLILFFHDKLLDEEETVTELQLTRVDSNENNHSDSDMRNRLACTSSKTASRLKFVFMDSINSYNDSSSRETYCGLGIVVILSNVNTFYRASLPAQSENRELSGPVISICSSRQALSVGRRSCTGNPTKGKSTLLPHFE